MLAVLLVIMSLSSFLNLNFKIDFKMFDDLFFLFICSFFNPLLRGVPINRL